MRQKGAIIDMKNFVFIASIAFFFSFRFSNCLVLYTADSRVALRQEGKIPEDRIIHMVQEEEGDGRQSHLLEEQGENGGQRRLDGMDDLVDGKEESNMTNGHVDGGLPLISDSVFSLIIMVYVLLAFFFVFFLFCWRRGAPSNQFQTKEGSHCLLKTKTPPTVVTPPTPPPGSGF